MDGNMSSQEATWPILTSPSCLTRLAHPHPHHHNHFDLPHHRRRAIIVKIGGADKSLSGCNAGVVVLWRILPSMCPNGVSNGNINQDPNQGRRRHNLRPTNTAPPRSRLQGEFTRLHHVMLIPIDVSFSSNRQYPAFLSTQVQKNQPQSVLTFSTTLFKFILL